MNQNTIPKSHLFCEEDLHLFDIQNIFTACALWLENGMENIIATYDLVVRDMPKNRNFMLAGGLEEIIEGIKKWRYSEDDVAYLIKNNLATSKLAEYLKKFKFTGDLYAMPEGTPFFPGEPVIRVTAPICEGNLLTMFLMNSLSSNTVFASKIIRCKIACGEKRLVGGGGMRAQSFESAMKGCRAGYITGADNGIPSFYRKYNIIPPAVSINAYHAVIKSFPTEIEAMRAAAELFPDRSRPMVDTYNFEQGIENLIQVAREQKAKGRKIAAITVDSGDLYERACYARKKFDEAGFPEIKITVASNLNEFKIKELRNKGTPADAFLVVTEISSVTDDPKIEVVFKLAELRDGEKIRQVAKFAPGKKSYPGRKQVFRVWANNQMQKDVIGLENEYLGEPLLVKVIDHGEAIYRLPQLPEIRDYCLNYVSRLPEKLRDIDKEHVYPVEISEKLQEMDEKVKREHLNH